MSVIAELKRRKVYKIGAAYLVVGWLLIQVSATVAPQLNFPEWVPRLVTFIILLGFPIALVSAWVFDVTAEGVKLDASASGSKHVFAGAAVLAVLALGWYFYGRPSLRKGEVVVPAASVAARASVAVPTKSIAVLAFTDLSPKHDQDYFSDGIAEELLNALAKVKDLKVAGRTSSFYYKGRNEDLRSIGKALGVANVLEGSVRTQGDKVRITAQLIRSEDGFHLWSETYDGDLKDVFALQERIARSITDQLKVVLAGKQTERLVNAGTENPEAYALYLQATDVFNRRDGERMSGAVKMLEQAVVLDPRYARAYSRLATLHWLLPTYTDSDPVLAYAQVRAKAQRAIALDAHLAEPWAALGMSSSARVGAGMVEARQQFEKALQLDPDDVTTNFWYGLTLARWGYQRAGVERIEHALAVDPMVPNVMRWRGVMYLRHGDLDGAEQFLKRAQAAGLGLAGRELAEIADRRGDIESARRLWQEGSQVMLRQLDVESRPGFSDAVSAGLLGGNASERKRGIAAIEAFLAREPRNVSGVTPMWLAQLGAGARALEVERAYVKTDNSDFAAYLFSPSGKSLRALPEFPGYLRAKGLPVLWDKYGAPDACHKAASGDYVCD